MDKEVGDIKTFGDIKTEKHKFYCLKSRFLEDLDIDNALVSNKIYLVEKNYI